jgi:hypothetical protein
MNSIFVQIVDDSRGSDGEKMIVCYPFFPPHLSLPLKTGEYVWIIKENIKGVEYYYWMCRKVGIIQVDDINFTNLERTSIISDMYGKKRDLQGAYTPDSETLEKMTSLGKSDNSNISQESYSDFLKNSYSYVNEFIGEPVPRMTKNSSDLLLQGSNNAGIHLTTEKFLQDYITTDADNLKSEFLGDTPPNFDKIKSPAIDLFVNRKKDTSNSSGRGNGPTAIYNTSATSGGINTTRNVSDGDAKLSHIEIDKIRDVVGNNDAGSIYEEELSNEAQNVGARLYMTNYCDVDVQFDSAIDGLDEQTGPSLVNYADYIRSIGKKDVRLISQNGESLINMDENGEIKIKASKDDGQQFLYLTPGSGGYTRINSAGKIYLTHGNDNNLPDNNDEPYVLASQLEAVLKTIFDVLNAHANLMIGLAPMRFPPMIPGAAQLVNQFLGTNAPTISTPSSKYSPAVELPPLAAPYTAKAAVIAGILKHKDIIADKG